MIDRQIQRRMQTLTEVGVPPPRAAIKAEGTVVGRLVALCGMMLCLVAGAGLLLALMRSVDIGLMLVLALAGLGVVGLGLVFFGASLISREAAPAIARIGQWIVQLVRAARGSNGGSNGR